MGQRGKGREGERGEKESRKCNVEGGKDEEKEKKEARERERGGGGRGRR